MHSAEEILSILDRCCDAFTFPMLDNGYVYLAATRLSVYRSSPDWAMVIEVFGFSPRAGLPDTHIYTFASKLFNRDAPEKYRTLQAYNNYLANNPHNDSRFIFSIGEGSWQDADNAEFVSSSARQLLLRGQPQPVPSADEYGLRGIQLEEPHRVRVFELCRFLAGVARERVLATSEERRVSVLPEMNHILQLEEWHHPDLLAGERPSGSDAFRQLAQVISSGDARAYHPSQQPNTDWRNWPEGGRL